MSDQPLPLAIVSAAISADPRQAAAGARAAGFAGLVFDAFTGSLDLTELSQTGRREFRHLLSTHNQSLVALNIDLGGKGLAPGADIDRILARLTQAMEAAKSLAVSPMVCVDLGPLPEPAIVEKPKPSVTPEQAGLIIIPSLSAPAPATAPTRPPPDPALVSSVDGALRELGSIADRMGVMVALRTELASYAAIDRALAAASCPWFGIDLDPVGVLRDEWSSDDLFSRLGSLVRHVRVRDAIAGADKRTKPAVVGRGSTVWPEFLSNLDAAGYKGWLTVDPLELSDRQAGASEAARFIRQLLATRP